MKIEDHELMTIQEVAKFLKISPSTIYNGTHPAAKNQFYIKHIRIGSSIRFKKKDVINYINRRSIIDEM